MIMGPTVFHINPLTFIIYIQLKASNRLNTQKCYCSSRPRSFGEIHSVIACLHHLDSLFKQTLIDCI